MHTRRRIGSALAIAAVAWLFAASAVAAETEGDTTQPERKSLLEGFRDPEDGGVDMSHWLLEKNGFLLVPIIITEPAVGNGFGLAPLFFRTPAQSQESKDRGDYIAPDIYGFAAFKTANGSKGYGAGGWFHFKDDAWRYAGAIGKVTVNLDYYTEAPGLGTHKIGYSIDGIASMQQVSNRIGLSKVYLSARWVYFDLNSRLDLASDNQFFQPKDFAQRSSGLGAVAEYDSRNNLLSPSAGTLAQAVATFYAPAIGSDNRFETYRAHTLFYAPFGERWVLGTRLDYRSIRGDPPFYQLPSIELRGIAYGRYQDRNVGMAEAELRFRFTPRWSVLGFGGAGRAWGRTDAFSDAPWRTTRGVGVRYLLARELGLDVGIDWARGPDDNAYYLAVGSAWR